MHARDVLIDAYGRIAELVEGIAGGASGELLTYRADPEANTIAWLLWHLTRVQDDHVADVAGAEQVWTAGGWVDRFGLPFRPGATGYGHRAVDVAAVRVPADLLLGYHRAVHEASVAFLRTVGDDDLDRVVDTAWDPPVTLGVRLVSVAGDDLQHAGQAAFVAGMARRAGVT